MTRKTLFALLIVTTLVAGCSHEPVSEWKAYVPQFSMPGGQSRVLIYSVPELDLLGHTDAGLVACRIAAHPDGEEIWVSCEGSKDVAVIDARADSLIGRMQLGLHTHGSAFSPDGGLYLVTHTAVVVYEEKSPSISIIDTATREMLISLVVGRDPRGACFGPEGRFAYVANMEDNTISVIDVEALAVTATVPTGPAPQDLAVDPAGGHLFVSCVGDRLPDGSRRGPGAVHIHRLPDLEEVARLEAGPHPSRVGFLPDGGLVISQMGSMGTEANPILFFEKGEGFAYRPDGELDLGHNPQFGAISPDGRWYVVVVDGREIVVADLARRTIYARRELDGARQKRYAAELLLIPAAPAGI